eukprot:NODE_4208_length_487_cov_99.102740_g3604_i0.p1 GENE.NODE_4208_length_487_cov_99.102740_g3604_i0~~NODE_4208_length_487_cov_99.102740_g3604_i0.p1  ORF type:complete len:112 (-),score=13.99 NODE_4208_length_487_cov_99.102740_g3604_i0:74-409(-)
MDGAAAFRMNMEQQFVEMEAERTAQMAALAEAEASARLEQVKFISTELARLVSGPGARARAGADDQEALLIQQLQSLVLDVSRVAAPERIRGAIKEACPHSGPWDGVADSL